MFFNGKLEKEALIRATDGLKVASLLVHLKCLVKFTSKRSQNQHKHKPKQFTCEIITLALALKRPNKTLLREPTLL